MSEIMLKYSKSLCLLSHLPFSEALISIAFQISTLFFPSLLHVLSPLCMYVYVWHVCVCVRVV